MVAPLVELERANTRARSLAEPSRDFLYIFEGDLWSLVSLFLAFKKNRVPMANQWQPLVFRFQLLAFQWQLFAFGLLSFGYLRELRVLVLIRVFPLPQYRNLQSCCCLWRSPSRRGACTATPGEQASGTLVLEGLHERGRIRFLGSVRATAR